MERLKLLKSYALFYAKIETVVIVSVTITAVIVYKMTANLTLVIGSVTVSDPAAFYLAMYFFNKKNETLWYHGVIRLVAVYFLPGVLNFLIFRPLSLYIFIKIFSSVWIGTAVGKLIADINFYCFAAPLNEIFKKYMPFKKLKAGD